MKYTPSSPVKYLNGVGEKRSLLLQKLGIFTVGDLLYLFPRAYQDNSRLVSIAEAPSDEICSVKAAVCYPCTEAKIRKGMTLYKTRVTDGETVMNITMFNRKWAAASLEQGEEYIFTGRVTHSAYAFEMNSPQFEKAESGERIRPVYPCTEGINSKLLEKLVRTALDNTELSEALPDSIRSAYCLMPLRQALENIHSPSSEDYLSEAKRRLIFEELFMLQLGLMRLKGKNSTVTPCVMQEDYTQEFASLLPFKMTGAQKRAVSDCISDMAGKRPMNRLLQGDVGSGKTAVAAALVYSAAKNGYRSALMAPTEVLAQQHYKTFCGFFENTGLKVALLTGSTSASEKKRIKEALSKGEIDFVTGTHALIQDDVEIDSLGLVITDEQHRFGVNQRSALGGKGEYPHTLVMSATPIPRTLALIIYSDLDLSVLDELPAGRQKIETFAVDSSKRERAYGYIRKHLIEGRQGYIVCPLVEEDEESEMVSAEELCRSLSEDFFSDFRVGLLHGKMKSDEKKKVMEDFSRGDIQLLVSTTVIEVGIDVPNAVIMVVENAERFGLSQLHQLRGRIGRGSHKSTCILISDASGPEAKHRMNVMVSTCDGFKIADEDLKQRGPGDFFGSRQHGLPDLKIADMLTDTDVLRETRRAAEALLRSNPSLEGEEYEILRTQVNRMFSSAMKS